MEGGAPATTGVRIEGVKKRFQQRKQMGSGLLRDTPSPSLAGAPPSMGRLCGLSAVKLEYFQPALHLNT